MAPPAYRNGMFLLICVFAFFIRLLVSLHSYSGAQTPPHFGDYEAQRHWMEITLHTPVQEWYVNTSHNDLGYWGLDYPPLTAYQSFFHGLALNALEPDSVALHTSRGYETPSSKLLMRWTVLTSDAGIFFPAAFGFVIVFYAGKKFEELAWALSVILLQPALILIDHGHFQYNCISLGLTLGAVAAIGLQKDYLASVLFCLALNHKQMSAYYAPAFFAYLFGKSMRRKRPVLEVAKLGVIVIGTFMICWGPFLHSKKAVMGVLSRLVPLQRGIFEDYVANFWCASSLVIKWKQFCSTSLLARLALVATSLSFLPSVVHQIRAPSYRGFLFALFNTSLSFYLFSYQVHEKSILLPLLPASLLILEDFMLYRGIVFCAMFSMFPLLRRDGLVVPFIATFALHLLLLRFPFLQRKPSDAMRRQHFLSLKHLSNALFIMGLLLNLAYMFVKPPPRYPFIFEAVNAMLVFGCLVLLGVYSNLQQLAASSSNQNMNLDKVKAQ
ncbi:hypothetical protein GOP47_0022794 [Adiantum capillus-veneris]|uniref:Alpha-1,3-glucosyltransferase n=1 Tax=Adiantum capillus-veneris TaxID=13818 RepID=A0A9D4U6I2_ADICA|nr:hypothetical protein GOP47_0022794 [Adiantum capillus-veneris]